jgi:hypothetical protein
VGFGEIVHERIPSRKERRKCAMAHTLRAQCVKWMHALTENARAIVMLFTHRRAHRR